MKAVVYHQYGSPDVLSFDDVAKPTPADDQVLVKIYAASLNAADVYMVRGKPFLARFDTGLMKPKHTIPGCDFSGIVESVGRSVTRFKAGDAVYGDLSGNGLGALAEYVTVPEKILALKPAKSNFEQSAAIPMAAVTALQGLRSGNVKSDDQVLVQGASGGVGTFAVQLARLTGAEVTAVCSTQKVDLMRSLGANHVIDYKQQDFTQGNGRYDLILAVNGYHSLRAYRRVLKPGGRYVAIGGAIKQIFETMLLGRFFTAMGDHKFTGILARPDADDLQHIKELVDTGKLTPVIDKVFAFEKIADAYRYLATGHARGKVVIQIAE